MAFPFQQAAFTVGEVGPALYGRQDLARTHVGASTLRNAFVRYTGGASSRAGTRFVGFSKQTGRNYPPRLIDFQFNVNQGLMLEFGHFYMRVVQNGAFVTDSSIAITNITQANPGVVTTAGALGAVSATSNTGAVVSSYAPGDTVTLAGGSYITPAILAVTNTRLLSTLVNVAGTGYVPADTIAPSGGTQSTPAELTVATTKVSQLPTIAAAGAGGTPGTATVVGTTGTGTPFQATVTINGGGTIASVDALTVAGSYTVNPAVLTNEPVNGGGLVGAQLSIVMGVNTVTVSNAGVFTANPSGLTFTQGSTSGAGTGATFRFALLGPNAVSVSVGGIYTAFPANPVSQLTTSGSGSGATFTVVSGAVSPFQNGDWVAISGVNGMTQVNGDVFVVAGATATTFQLTDVYGATVNTSTFSAYSGGGTAARIYTLTTPYAETDLPWIKFVQSADVMSLCCFNQESGSSYVPYELSRFANNNWTIAALQITPDVNPPSGGTGSASSSGAVDYQYVVTSVSPDNGSESVASDVIQITSAVNIAATAGTITLTWDPVPEILEYNVYKCTPGIGSPIPVGVQFGFAGKVSGTQFIDTNIVPDFSQVPPAYANPFAPGQIISAIPVSGGSGYTTAGVTINTATGSGAVLQAAIVGGVVKYILIKNPGSGYAASDTLTITGDGTGATAILRVGPTSGTYPSVPSYVQQRRFYANSPNNPNTYWMSQPGAYTNFDKRSPTLDSDAITGNPWALQLDGIQFVANMPGGAIIFTGQQPYQLTGNGGSSFNPQPITPSTQQVQPQAYHGCSAVIPPQQIEDEIIFVQAHGAVVRSMGYQYANNIYTGTDLTLNSPQLFTGFSIREWAWCEEPYKVEWAVRNDGVMLSLTRVKAQEVAGWARHDTQGKFVSCCSVTELPVDALYVATQRFVGSQSPYMIERMDDRIWDTVEDSWCVDAAISLSQPMPAATLNASSAKGLGSIVGVTALVGGSGYSNSTTAQIIDENVTTNGAGPGTGATASLTIAGGVITAVNILTPGAGYLYPKLVISDPQGTGTGASARLTLSNAATFTASAGVFGVGVTGYVIRMGGGVAVITQRNSATEVVANILSPIVDLVPNTTTPMAASSGEWTLTQPVSTISGLRYLAGKTVTGLYDGKVLPATVVPSNGTISLPEAASSVVVGLRFDVQIQSLYIDPPGLTSQARRKDLPAATARIEASGGFLIGSNQPDGAALSPIEVAPTWQGMSTAPVPVTAITPYNSTTVPLYTGDIRIPIKGGWDKRGQVAVQQSDPKPLNLLSFITEMLPGDMPEDDPQRQRNRDRVGNVRG